MTRRRGFALAAAVLLLGPFAALTVLVLLTAPGVFSLDAEIAAGLHRPALEHPGLGSALRVIGQVSQPYWLRLIALLAALLLWRRGRGRAAGWLLLTMTIGGVLGVVLKQVFARSRPEWPEAITVISGYSFPSGHALNSMLAAGCALVFLVRSLSSTGRRLLWTAAVAFVLLVGFDRLALGVHYLTDVLAGWALALAILFAALAVFDPAPTTRPDSAQRSDSVTDHAPAADRPSHPVATDPGPARGGDRGSQRS
jgi:membrane-associated phospholipid phosphatase